VTVPGQLYGYIKSRADRFGLTLSAYVKNLIIDDVKDNDIPVFKMSKKLEKRGLEALKEYRAGKTKEIKDVEEYFRNL